MLTVTFDWVLEGGVQLEDDLLDEIAEIFIVDPAHVADPSMCVPLAAFLSEGKGERAVYVGEDNFISFFLFNCFDVHDLPRIGLINIMHKNDL
jgi:hypothetical protein